MPNSRGLLSSLLVALVLIIASILIASMKSYLAAAVQMNSVPDLDKNLAQAEDLIDLAVRQGAELVCLPENFSFFGR